MKSRISTVLLKSPIPKLNLSQGKEKTVFIAVTQNNNYSSVFDKEKNTKNQKEPATDNASKSTAIEKIQAFPLKLQGHISKHLQLLSLSPDVLFLKSVTADYISLLNREMSLKHVRNILSGNFSTSSSHSQFWDKFINVNEGSAEVTKIKQETPFLKTQPVVLQGFGWAGQPVVRRVHPILPEVCSHRCDIFTALKELPINNKAPSHTINVDEKDNTSQSQFTKNLSLRVPEKYDKSITSNNKTEVMVEEVHTEVTNTERIIDKSEIVKNDVLTNYDSQRANSSFTPPEIIEKDLSAMGQILPVTGLKHKKNKCYQKVKGTISGLDVTKSRKIRKTKIVISSSKSDSNLKNNEVLKKKKKKFIGFGINNKNKYLDTPFLLNQLADNQAQNNVMHVEKRQFKTYSPVNQAKASRKTHMTDQSSSKISTKQSSTNKALKENREGKFPEDCKCPETLEVKTRFSTNICGEAANLEEKKSKKERKQKMCPVERKIKQKKKTFVCVPIEKFSKSKKKRQLPKCIKPEKIVAPRVEVCPPNLLHEEEAKNKKKCVIQVEEVKVRKRTKVCRPVIIQYKEEASVSIEKKVCVEKKVKQKQSRHTTVCPPLSDGNNRNISSP